MGERSLQEECDERSGIIGEGELAVLGGHLISVFFFFLSELNFSAVAVCPLSYLKDFHVSSCNSMSFKMDFFYPLVSAKSVGGILGTFTALQ